MTFVSAAFVVFLIIVFLLHWFVFKPVKWRNIFIVAASLVFYAWADWRLLGLILFTTVTSFVSGIMIEQAATKRLKKTIAAISVAINLAILATFKYLDFFIEGISQLLTAIGLNANISSLNIILPIGISFYTLQAVGYTIDVYKNKFQATHNAPAFFAYITFFPQLVAGPIERTERLVPQFAAQRQFDYTLAVDGLRQLLWGFIKKMLVADTCAKAVDTIWAAPDQYGGATLVIGAILFTIQIYADFSGYSDIAIGTAKFFGIRLTKNFDVPFFSRNVAEFWRRWHISLMKWFTRYVYIPLGGSRCGKAKHLRNIAIVFLISGLWHGANITYVSWGAFHAVALIICVALGNNTRYDTVVAHNRHLPTIRECLQILSTFTIVIIGFVIFRADSMSDAILYLKGMASGWGAGVSSLTWLAQPILYCVALMLIDWCCRRKDHPLAYSAGSVMRRTWLRWVVYYILFALLIYSAYQHGGQPQGFIYFQF